MYNVTFPLARLEVSTDFLSIKASGEKELILHPDQVVAIRKRKSRFFSSGLQIYHNVTEYPAPVVFWCNPVKAEKTIAEAGFIPKAIGAPDLEDDASISGFRILFVILMVLFVGFGVAMMLFGKPSQ